MSQLTGVLDGLLSGERHDRIHFRIHPLDLFQVRSHCFSRAQLFTPD
ncbi:MAG TPA: hypothetical protein VIX37_22365 [Candidatus Sulfotelmatobacter sp.]